MYNSTTDPLIIKAEQTGNNWLGQIVKDIYKLRDRIESENDDDAETKEDIDSDRATEDRYERMDGIE